MISGQTLEKEGSEIEVVESMTTSGLLRPPTSPQKGTVPPQDLARKDIIRRKSSGLGESTEEDEEPTGVKVTSTF